MNYCLLESLSRKKKNYIQPINLKNCFVKLILNYFYHILIAKSKNNIKHTYKHHEKLKIINDKIFFRSINKS